MLKAQMLLYRLRNNSNDRLSTLARISLGPGHAIFFGYSLNITVLTWKNQMIDIPI
jgi:hypothetical protein